MPSRKNKSLSTKALRHIAFYPLVGLCLILWFVYRQLFQFPVWFDEVIGKAIFFGLPVWLYVTVTRYWDIADTFSTNKLQRGLLLGLAVGGLFGFAASLAGIVRTGGQVQSALLFTSDRFWWEFLLSLVTSFWETLFFFSWIMVVIQDKHAHWPLFKQVMWVAIIFMAFHLPNIFLRFSGPNVVVQIFILSMFALGQAFIFARRHNAYALVLAQAIWGMVLLVHLL